MVHGITVMAVGMCLCETRCKHLEMKAANNAELPEEETALRFLV